MIKRKKMWGRVEESGSPFPLDNSDYKRLGKRNRPIVLSALRLDGRRNKDSGTEFLTIS
jgi:hypothetical protein